MCAVIFTFFLLYPKAKADWTLREQSSNLSKGLIGLAKTWSSWIYILDMEGNLYKTHEKNAEITFVFNMVKESGSLSKKTQNKQYLDLEAMDQFIEDEIDSLKEKGLFEELAEEIVETSVDEEQFIKEEKEEASKLKRLAQIKSRIYSFEKNLVVFFAGRMQVFSLNGFGKESLRRSFTDVQGLKCQGHFCLLKRERSFELLDLLKLETKVLSQRSSQDQFFAIEKNYFAFAKGSFMELVFRNQERMLLLPIPNGVLDFISLPEDLVFIKNLSLLKIKIKNLKERHFKGNLGQVLDYQKSKKGLFISTESGLWLLSKRKLENLSGLAWPKRFAGMSYLNKNLWLGDLNGRLYVLSLGQYSKKKVLRRIWASLIAKDPPVSLVIKWARQPSALFAQNFSKESEGRRIWSHTLPDLNFSLGLFKDEGRLGGIPRETEINDLNEDEEIEEEIKTSGYYKRKNQMDWSLSLSWDLQKTFFDRRSLNHSLIRESLHKKRRDLVFNIIQSYYQRRVYQLKLARGERSTQNSLKFQELSAFLNAMTYFCFEKYRKGQKPCK